MIFGVFSLTISSTLSKRICFSTLSCRYAYPFALLAAGWNTVVGAPQVETVGKNGEYLCVYAVRRLCGISFQLFVGLTLETEQGHLRTLFVYVCGILAGAVGSMLVNPTQTIYGSSAAVYSLLFSNLSHCLLVGEPKESIPWIK